MMIGLFCFGALLIAGLLTLLPGRIMHKVVRAPGQTLFGALEIGLSEACRERA